MFELYIQFTPRTSLISTFLYIYSIISPWEHHILCVSARARGVGVWSPKRNRARHVWQRVVGATLVTLLKIRGRLRSQHVLHDDQITGCTLSAHIRSGSIDGRACPAGTCVVEVGDFRRCENPIRGTVTGKSIWVKNMVRSIKRLAHITITQYFNWKRRHFRKFPEGEPPRACATVRTWNPYRGSTNRHRFGRSCLPRNHRLP